MFQVFTNWCLQFDCRTSGKNGDILGSMQKIGMFMVTDTIGSFIHTLVFLPIVYFALRGRIHMPFKGLRDTPKTALSIAFR